MCHIGISSAKLEKINDICKYYIAFFLYFAVTVLLPEPTNTNYEKQ